MLTPERIEIAREVLEDVVKVTKEQLDDTIDGRDELLLQVMICNRAIEVLGLHEVE